MLIPEAMSQRINQSWVLIPPNKNIWNALNQTPQYYLEVQQLRIQAGTIITLSLPICYARFACPSHGLALTPSIGSNNSNLRTGGRSTKNLKFYIADKPAMVRNIYTSDINNDGTLELFSIHNSYSG